MNRRSFVLLFGLVFSAVGIFLGTRGFEVVRNAKASESWPVAKGQVVLSEVESHRTTMGDAQRRRSTRMYKASVLYEYDVEGSLYSSNQVHFGDHSSDKPTDARKIVNRYPEGTGVQVHYDPERPELAVLEPGSSRHTYLQLGLGVVFSIVGPVVFLGGLVRRV